MTAPNPYAPPISEEAAQPADPASLGELVRGWEKLRLLYNGILFLPGLGILILWVARMHLPWGLGIVASILVAVGANVMFLLGPLVELYLRGIFRQGTPIGRGRMLIFGGGLVVSAGFFLIAMFIAIFGGKN